jgi:hypothetical protein
LPEQWKKSITLPIYKNGDKIYCSNYRGISRFSNTYKTLPKILLSSLTPHAEEIIRVHQYGFRRNRSTIDHIFFSLLILKNTLNNMRESVLQLFIDFKKVFIYLGGICYIYNILIECGTPIKPARSIKMCLNETYSTVRVGKHLFDMSLLRMV